MPLIIVVMGVAGSGKTTVGTRLAEALGCDYLEGDSLHPPANLAKMSQGIPLTDADRAPWLAEIHAQLVEDYHRGRCRVVGCSALKKSYRQLLSGSVPVTWVYLKGAEELLRRRLEARIGHFLKSDMLEGQLETLEEPLDTIVADVSHTPEAIVEQILNELGGRPDVRISADLEELSLRAAQAMVGVIEDAVRARGRCSLALSGGRTPRTLYGLLGSRYRDRIPWQLVDLFWTDERYVPADDERSNYRMVRETLLDGVPYNAANVHPMLTSFPQPETAAREHEAMLREYFRGEWPSFDLVLLGLGADGHTASLFPGSVALREKARWVLAVRAPADPPTRLTLTLPVLSRSACTFFLVSGSDKAPHVRRAIQGSAEGGRFPGAMIEQSQGKVVWWIDRDAASELD